MPNISIYLDDETDQLVAESAKASGLSKSKWIAVAIRRQARDEWPVGWLDLAGSIADFPVREDMADAPLATDAKRLDF